MTFPNWIKYFFPEKFINQNNKESVKETKKEEPTISSPITLQEYCELNAGEPECKMYDV